MTKANVTHSKISPALKKYFLYLRFFISIQFQRHEKYLNKAYFDFSNYAPSHILRQL